MHINKKILFLILGLSLHGAIQCMEMQPDELASYVTEFACGTHDIKNIKILGRCLDKRKEKTANLEEWVKFINDTTAHVVHPQNDTQSAITKAIAKQIEQKAFSSDSLLPFEVCIINYVDGLLSVLHDNFYFKGNSYIFKFVKNKGDLQHILALADWLAEKRTIASNDEWALFVQELITKPVCPCITQDKAILAVTKVIVDTALQMRADGTGWFLHRSQLINRSTEALYPFLTQ